MATYTKKKISENGNHDVSKESVEISEVDLTVVDEKPKDTNVSRLQIVLQLGVCVICGILFGLALEKGRGEWFRRLAQVLKTNFHQCVISYTCSQSNSDGSVLKQSHQS